MPVFDSGHRNGGIWNAYTPTVINLTLGTGGTVTGRFSRIGNTIDFMATATLGTGFAITSPPGLTLPVPADLFIYADIRATLSDSGTNSYNGAAILNAGSVQVYALTAAHSRTAVVAAAVPFAWAAGDALIFAGTYEAAT